VARRNLGARSEAPWQQSCPLKFFKLIFIYFIIFSIFLPPKRSFAPPPPLKYFYSTIVCFLVVALAEGHGDLGALSPVAGAHRRGKWGAAAPPGDILAPLDDFCPSSDFYSGPLISENAGFWIEKTFQFQWRPFFLENASFWVIKTLQFRWRPFFFVLRTLVFGTKSNPISAKNRISRCRQTLASLVLPPLS